MRLTALAVIALIAPSAAAPPANGEADIALCDIQQVQRWGHLDGVTSYSIGTTTVNLGDADLDWIQIGTSHPVIAQNMYRVLDGAIEHVGQGWAKHGFCALQIPGACAGGCPGEGGCLSHLAPGCQTSNSAASNGSQTILGPRWQINAHTGAFTYPYDQFGQTGDVLYKRIQVHDVDLGLDDALYFVEGITVAADDAAARLQNNNASYRMVSIGGAPTFAIGFVAGQATEFARPAIFAWSMHGLGVDQPDPGVTITPVQVPDDGLFHVGSKVTDNGDGTWHYEYAIENLNSHRSARALTVPLAAGVTITNPGFHDVDYHSGDGGPGPEATFDGTDWPAVVSAAGISWSTDTEAVDPLANALRWGTLYNFRFDADAPPVTVTATLGLYRAGDPEAVTVEVPGPGPGCPADLDGDGVVGISDFLIVLGAWGGTGGDVNGDGTTDILDFLAVLGGWGACP